MVRLLCITNIRPLALHHLSNFVSQRWAVSVTSNAYVTASALSSFLLPSPLHYWRILYFVLQYRFDRVLALTLDHKAFLQACLRSVTSLSSGSTALFCQFFRERNKICLIHYINQLAACATPLLSQPMRCIPPRNAEPYSSPVLPSNLFDLHVVHSHRLPHS
jgi:hypothetical protein